jgi:hypothetical protein
MNFNIKWTESLYDEFKDKIYIGALSRCTSFPWTEEFIDKHILDLFYSVTPEGEVEKSYFANNPGLPWSEQLVDKYAEHWDWMRLSMNESVPFTIEMLDKYADKWDYESLEFNKRIINDETLRSYLNIFYDRDVRQKFHKCEYCFKGEEVLEEIKGEAYNTKFITCPNFNWSENFASKLKKVLRGDEAAKIVVRSMMWESFKHWNIDVLDAFEEYWDYSLLYLVEELNDYIALKIKESRRLKEVMSKIYKGITLNFLFDLNPKTTKIIVSNTVPSEIQSSTIQIFLFFK